MPKFPWIHDPKKAKVKISGREQFFGPHIFLLSTGHCHYGFLLLTLESGKRWFPLSPY